MKRLLRLAIVLIGIAPVPAQAQDKPATVTLAALVERGFEVKGVAMPDHHAVNFIAQQGKTVYWCQGTNFGRVLIGKEAAIRTQCFEVK